MREIARDAPQGSTPEATLTLPFDLRQKSRLRAKLDGGEEIALLMPRGRVLRGGDLLYTEDDVVVLVRAAEETVSVVEAKDARTLARAAYHLGNRHVPVQVGAGWLRYQHDHVLDDMVGALGLGLTLRVERAAFEPEGGAYGGGHVDGNAHVHDHDHDHGDDHDHQHDHGHHRGVKR